MISYPRDPFQESPYVEVILEHCRWSACPAESPGDVAPDAQSRNREHPERTDGGVLLTAGLSRIADCRRHVALCEWPGIRAHPRYVLRRAGGGMEAGYQGSSCQGREDVCAAHALRTHRSSFEPAQGRTR